MRYAVTAVSGQLGQEIARKLIELTDRSSVIGLARTPGNVTDLGIEVRPGDYDKPNDLRKSLAGVDALVLVSGMAPPEDRIGQHRNVIEAAKAAGVGKIVYAAFRAPRTGLPFRPSCRAIARPKPTSAPAAWAGPSVAMASTLSLTLTISIATAPKARSPTARGTGNAGTRRAPNWPMLMPLC